MATENVTPGDGSPIHSKAEILRARAERLLDEMGEQNGQAFAVASGGRAYVGKNQITEFHMFEVIEDILSDILLQNELRKTITELAALAEVHHG